MSGSKKVIKNNKDSLMADGFGPDYAAAPAAPPATGETDGLPPRTTRSSARKQAKDAETLMTNKPDASGTTRTARFEKKDLTSGDPSRVTRSGSKYGGFSGRAARSSRGPSKNVQTAVDRQLVVDIGVDDEHHQQDFPVVAERATPVAAGSFPATDNKQPVVDGKDYYDMLSATGCSTGGYITAAEAAQLALKEQQLKATIERPTGKDGKDDGSMLTVTGPNKDSIPLAAPNTPANLRSTGDRKSIAGWKSQDRKKADKHVRFDLPQAGEKYKGKAVVPGPADKIGRQHQVHFDDPAAPQSSVSAIIRSGEDDSGLGGQDDNHFEANGFIIRTPPVNTTGLTKKYNADNAQAASSSQPVTASSSSRVTNNKMPSAEIEKVWVPGVDGEEGIARCFVHFHGLIKKPTPNHPGGVCPYCPPCPLHPSINPFHGAPPPMPLRIEPGEIPEKPEYIALTPIVGFPADFDAQAPGGCVFRAADFYGLNPDADPSVRMVDISDPTKPFITDHGLSVSMRNMQLMDEHPGAVFYYDIAQVDPALRIAIPNGHPRHPYYVDVDKVFAKRNAKKFAEKNAAEGKSKGKAIDTAVGISNSEDPAELANTNNFDLDAYPHVKVDSVHVPVADFHDAYHRIIQRKTMSENAPPAATAATGTNANESVDHAKDMAEYQKQRNLVKHDITRLAKARHDLALCESGIATTETRYLESTPNGNIITGFENYTKGGTGAAAQRRKAGTTDQNRIFSRSSVSYNALNQENAPTPASGTSTPGAPTPVSTSFANKEKDKANASDAPTPTSATTEKKAPGASKKKKERAIVAEDSETDSQPKKVRTHFGANARK
ncbi:hypothetical protein BJ170DRAFT_14995 [Xylariales sp. AK1849]|nr:hypothetical protein BJ170DRAFT_14995 [Xylariales sp. AK1849]